VAGEVGLGWVLNLGGTASRTINGTPDENNNTNIDNKKSFDEINSINIVLCAVDRSVVWFVCIASCGSHVFATQAAQGQQDNKLIFKESIQFVSLPKDFVITLDVYTLQLQRVTLPPHKEQYRAWPVCVH
jgi:hypothetical protein